MVTVGVGRNARLGEDAGVGGRAAGAGKDAVAAAGVPGGGRAGDVEVPLDVAREGVPREGVPREGVPPAPPPRRRQFEAEALVHLDALYSFALKLARSRDDAEDLVSDTVLRAFERWEQYHLGTNIRAWLFTILYHVFVSRKRRIDAREVQPADDGDGRLSYEAVGEVDPERRFYDSFLDEEITRAIDTLPVEYRSAVVLSDVHELRYAEIARILHVPEGTVKSRLFRGRRLLQKKLLGYAVDMGYIKQPSGEAA